MPDPSSIQTAVSAGAGIIGGGSFVMWLFKSYIGKVDKLLIAVAKLEATVAANNHIKNDVRDHEKRISILEPKVSRAHERLDQISKH